MQFNCKFKKEAMKFLASLCSHATEKGPLRSFFAKCLKCLSLNVMVESSRSCEQMFEKPLEKLVFHKQLLSRKADAAKLEFSNFLSTTVKENKNSFVKFVKFDKQTDLVDTFIQQFFRDVNKFIMLRKVFKMLIMFSHGQATVERGFKVNGKL